MTALQQDNARLVDRIKTDIAPYKAQLGWAKEEIDRLRADNVKARADLTQAIIARDKALSEMSVARHESDDRAGLIERMNARVKQDADRMAQYQRAADDRDQRIASLQSWVDTAHAQAATIESLTARLRDSQTENARPAHALEGRQPDRLDRAGEGEAVPPRRQCPQWMEPRHMALALTPEDSTRTAVR
ncbi:MAG: hypothetical protein E6Q76_05785 [Rhizobium sp.]|nr:MAG: hypothetical protein E6Q76_05785 [Rhizobium sp.]